MYRKSFLIVILALALMGILFTGSRIVASSDNKESSGLPSSYDPGVTVEEAILSSSSKPLLVEFYADSCGYCRKVTPWIHTLAEKRYGNRLTLVMVDVTKPENSQIADIFGVSRVPSVFVFDFKNMSRIEVSDAFFTSKETLEAGIDKALGQVKKPEVEQNVLTNGR